MKPKNIAFVTTFDTYDGAVEHWNKIKGKEEYGIGVAGGKHFIINNKAIDAVFEENQQEPVAWIINGKLFEEYFRTSELDKIIPLYTAPRELSDDEIHELANKHLFTKDHDGAKVVLGLEDFAKALMEKMRNA
jgi:hypothetical protein